MRRGLTKLGGLVVAAFCVAAAPLGVGAAWAGAKDRLFGYPADRLGATRDHLPIERYMRLLPASYALSGEALRNWQGVVDVIRRNSPEQKLHLAQEFFATVPYKTDLAAFGREDYWASVGEFLTTGGDCEDYALTKYRLLVDAGFPPEHLRVVLVEEIPTGRAHAVLTARVDGRTLVLDNQIEGVVDARKIRTYRPLYSMNEFELWAHTDPKAPTAIEMIPLSADDIATRK